MCVPYEKLDVLRWMSLIWDRNSIHVTCPTGKLVEMKSYIFGVKTLTNNKVIYIKYMASDVNADVVYVSLPQIKVEDEAP